MTLQEMLVKAKQLNEEAQAIYGDVDNQLGEGSAEELEKADRMFAEAEDLVARATRLNEIQEKAYEIDNIDASVEGAGDVDAGDGRNARPTDEQLASAGFKSFGDFLHSVWMRQDRNRPDNRLVWYSDEGKSGMDKKDLEEGSGAAGGFLVPPDFQNELLAIAAENSIVRPRATVIPMRRREIRLPVVDQSDSTADQPHWFGGMTFSWADEAASKVQSDPAFRQVTLIAHKLIGYTRASDELVDDAAISLDAFLRGPMGFAGGAAWMEDFAFLQGGGAGEPLGVLNAGATISVARQADELFDYLDFANMLENFLPSGNGVWVVSQAALAELITLQGPTGNPAFIWLPNAQDSVPGRLLGFPVVFTEKLPGFADTPGGDVLLADFSYYLIGDRQATTIDSTTFDRWRFDQTSWRMVHRVDGQPWLNAPITLQDGTAQISPFVILGDKAT